MSYLGSTKVKDARPKHRGLSAPRANRWVAGLTLILLIVAIPGLFFPSYLLISLAACMSLIVTLPLWSQEEIDWFSTWSFVLYGVFVGVLLRAVYITLDIPDAFTVQRVFLLGESKGFLLLPALLMTGGLLSMTVGYLAGPKQSRKITLPVFESDHWNQARLTMVVFLLLLVSVLALSRLVMLSGGLSLTNLSSKRFIARSIEEYGAHGYLRLGAEMSKLVVYLLTAKIASGKKPQVKEIVLLTLGLALALFDDLYQSSRGSLVFLLLSMLAIMYYLRRDEIKTSSVVFIGVLSLFLIRVLTFLRKGWILDWSLVRQSFDLMDSIYTVILTRNFIDLGNTAHVIAAIPDSISYQWGRTLVLWTVAWIPRSLWGGKPVISIGQILGPVVFGTSSRMGGGGVPPGFIAELYWNFSVPGVVLGCFFAGYFLRLVYAHFSANSWNRNTVLLYTASFMKLGMSLLGGDLTRTIIGCLGSFVPLYAILYFVTERPSSTPGGNR